MFALIYNGWKLQYILISGDGQIEGQEDTLTQKIVALICILLQIYQNSLTPQGAPSIR